MHPIVTLMGIIVLSLAGYYIYRNYGGMIAPAAEEVPPPTTTPPPTETPTTGIDPSPTCPGGEECVSSNGGSRNECDAAKGDSYEATWCGSFSGDQMTVKLYGPGHSSDGDCCWCNMIVHEDGTFAAGGEGPHPSSNCEHAQGESLGGSSDVCIKAVMEPGPKLTGYGLVDGAWKQMIVHEGSCGCDETSDTKTGDQVAFRCDGNLETTCATVKELGAATGSTPTTTPPPADGEETEEEPAADGEEEEEEEEEEEGNIARVLRAKMTDWEFKSAREFKLSYRGVRLGNF